MQKYPSDKALYDARDRVLDALKSETLLVAMIAIEYAFVSYVVHLRDTRGKSPSELLEILAIGVMQGVHRHDLAAPVGVDR